MNTSELMNSAPIHNAADPSSLLVTLCGAGALGLYLLGFVIVARHLFRHPTTASLATSPASEAPPLIAYLRQRPKLRLLLPGGIALLAHLIYSIQTLVSLQGFNLGLLPLLSFVGALMVIGTLTVSLQRPFENITIIVYPVVSLLLLLSLGFKGGYLPRSSFSTSIWIHIVLSLLAYSTLAIAFAQALLVLAQNHQLKHKHLAGMIQVLPPLQLMEAILFGLIWIGVTLLTLSISTGLLFHDDFFSQKLAHKAFFTLAAWFIFATLLVGHYRAGWRGITAVRWTIVGFVTLVVGFVGTKIVLEFLLTSSN